MLFERHIPVRLEELEAAPLLGRVALLVREEACRDLRLGVVLDRRPVAVHDRDEEVPVGPAVAVEPRCVAARTSRNRPAASCSRRIGQWLRSNSSMNSSSAPQRTR